MTGVQGQLEDRKELCGVWMSAYSHHVYTLKFLLVALYAFQRVIMPGIMNFNEELELSDATASKGHPIGLTDCFHPGIEVHGRPCALCLGSMTRRRCYRV